MDLPFEINTHGKLVDKTDPQSLIAKYLATAVGRQKLAASMVRPIRRNIDYQGIARKCMLVDPMPQGALPFYEKEPEAASVIRADRVVMPRFEIFQNPTVKITEVKQRRFNLIDRDSPWLRINPRGKLVGSKLRYTVMDRAVNKARYEIMEQEDRRIFEQLDLVGRDK